MKLFSVIVAQWLAAIVGVTAASLAESVSHVSGTGPNAAGTSRLASFGPAGCVSLSQSTTGTCVIATNCDGQDISKVEFAFDCEAAQNGDIVRHSFGAGGFDENEEFDTEVKCHTCSLPTPDEEIAWTAKLASQPSTQEQQSMQKRVQNNAYIRARNQMQEQIQQQSATALRLRRRTLEQQTRVRYGPNDCVSTYRSPKGNCVMVTDCVPVDIKDYEFGLVCVDKAGSPVRHLFGKDSFDPQETFDTLITCDLCLGLEDVPGDVALAGQVAALSDEVAGLKGMMTNLTTDITTLESAVFADEDQANATDMGASAAGDTDGDGVTVLLRPTHKHRNLRAAANLAVNSRRHSYDNQRTKQQSTQGRHHSVHHHSRRHRVEAMDLEVRDGDESGKPLHYLQKHVKQRPRLDQAMVHNVRDGDQRDRSFHHLRRHVAQRARFDQEASVSGSEEERAQQGTDELGEDITPQDVEAVGDGDDIRDAWNSYDSRRGDCDGCEDD